MQIVDNNSSSRIITCMEAALHFLLNEEEALEIVERQIDCIEDERSAMRQL